MIIIKAVFIGILEGLTEFLPVSSTGHMILADQFIQLSENPVFTNAFQVIIQLGAILAVVYLFWDRLWIFKGWKLKKDTLGLWFKILLAVLPAAVLGLRYDDALSASFFKPFPVAVALIFYGVVLIVIENVLGRGAKPPLSSVQRIGWGRAFVLGLFQCLALIPGTSRSAATIIGGLLLGLSRQAAAEFSFFLAIPTMCGAALLKIAKVGGDFSPLGWLIIAIGFTASFLTAVIVLRLFLDYIQKHNFKLFGWYRIGLGLLVLWFLR
ncbi:MAG: undecaprenyl-diphosphate phosphatase [Candidatus Margulisbacteria bacterium]|jgi:undecaprenyl-diphosphatase|nr:undecaprenyl-diphosphate phosphatase [Candidatus Margulisiibacteriota bacterium]